MIPFVGAYLLFAARKKWHALLFVAIAGLGPISWLAHNQFYYSNALEFYNGEYSAKAIYARQLARGFTSPGDHDWHTAFQYYFAAVKLVIGWPLLIAALAGIAGIITNALRAFHRRVTARARERNTFAPSAAHRLLLWPFALLALPPLFYVWSVHSGATPVYVPNLWPNTWYNTRYALAALPLASFAAAALAAAVPYRIRSFTAAAITGAVVLFWLIPNGSPLSICWKESEINSEARRQWTSQAAEFMTSHRKDGSSILLSFGADLPGILRVARIPIRYALHDGNHPAWDATIARPELFLREKWAIAVVGDPVSKAIQRARSFGLHYDLKKEIIVERAPVIQIFERQPLSLSQDPEGDFGR